MSLRVKIILLLLIVFATFIGVDYSIDRFVVYPSFVALEREEAIKDLERAREAIQREVEHLSFTCDDWAGWDPSLRFVVDRNQEFIDESLAAETFAATRLDIICYVKPDGTITWAKEYDAETGELLDMKALPTDRLPPDHILVVHDTRESKAEGLMISPVGPILLASRPIMNTQREGPVGGALIMGRFLSEEALASMAEQTRVDFGAMPISQGHLSASEQQALTKLLPGGPPLVEELNRDELAVYSVFPDLFGNSAMLLRANVKREITARGAAATQYAMYSVLVAGIIVLVVLLIALQRLIVGPITWLTNQVTDIGHQDDLTRHLELQRTDEIGLLVREFSSMMKQLDESRTNLLATSRQAGMAEVAAGVLHNVGNTLTSINVSTGIVQNRIRNTRLTGLPRATNMLEEHQDDLARFLVEDEQGQHLPGYLIALGQYFESEQTEILKELSALVQNVDHVGRIIQAQQEYAKISGVNEKFPLNKLLEHALTIVGAHHDLLQIKVKCEFEEIPPICTDRNRLLQILVNLISNAVQAMSDQMNDPRCLTLRVFTPSPQYARIEVLDNGMGIESKNLERVFGQGFTTKKDGHGFGLHHSANTARELGWKLSVVSDGPGCGATFTLDLPLQPHEAKMAA